MGMSKMKWRRFIVWGITGLLLSMSDAHSADWSLYFENELGNKFFIDVASTQPTPDGTVRVWMKVVPAENASTKVTIEEMREVDCSRRRYKRLQGWIYGPTLRSLEPTEGWYDFGPDDLNRALFDTVCGKGKKD